jgi:hypothetical protein
MHTCKVLNQKKPIFGQINYFINKDFFVFQNMAKLNHVRFSKVLDQRIGFKPFSYSFDLEAWEQNAQIPKCKKARNYS